MNPRYLGLLLCGLVFVGAPHSAKGQVSRSSEQTVFSAEDAQVKSPVPIPKNIFEILKEDTTVKGALEDEHIPPENLPTSWFSASTIHLSKHNKLDLIVVGNPPLSGGNLAMFWVFRATASGHELVLNTSAHSLEVMNTRWNGHKDIETIGATAVAVTTVLYRFDGKKYSLQWEKTSQIK